MLKMGGKILLWMAFAFSIFSVSDQFYHPNITAQYYVTVLSLCLIVILISVVKITLCTYKKIFDLHLLKGLYIIGLLQAIYGVCQYLNIVEATNPTFSVIGSFDNPAGFSSILSMLFPIGIYWSIHSNSWKQISVIISTLIYILAVIMSGARTGCVAMALSFFVIIYIELPKYKKLFRKNIISGGVILLFSIGVVLLYQLKPDSVNGRILIWNICADMIMDKPLLGFGSRGFNTNYMDYQAKYFSVHPNSYFNTLASNIDHPFNEFIKITIEYGISALIVLLLLIFICFYITLKYGRDYKSIIFAILISIMLLSFFSYPMKYPSVWMILALYICFLASNIISSIACKNKFTIIRILSFIFVSIAICYFHIQINAERKWKQISNSVDSDELKQIINEYKILLPTLNHNPYFIYNYAAVLNRIGQYDESRVILELNQTIVNDYETQLLLADNYCNLKDYKYAISIYKHTSDMIPCRFVPLYRLFEIYKSTGQYCQAKSIAVKIVDKEVKIPSLTVLSIKSCAHKFLTKINRNMIYDAD